MGLERIGSWLPFLEPVGEWFTILTPLILLWLLVVTLPGRFLGWMRNKVAGLREQLPKKFDPPEDKPAAYLDSRRATRPGRICALSDALAWR